MQKNKAGKLKKYFWDCIRAKGVKDRFENKKKSILYSLAFNYLNGYRNLIYKMDFNGEEALLHKLQNNKKDKMGVFFDVGANIGEWSRLVADKFDGTEVFSFEMCPETFNNLKKNTEGLNINSFNIAMSDQDIDEFQICCKGDNYRSNSIDIISDISIETVNVKMLTGDSFCKIHGINKIDFLKIDVEGHELKVLEGFKNMIHEQRINLIQFELNAYGINQGITLKDFKNFFGDIYIIGKIYPKHIDFLMEDSFKFWESSPNYVAVKADSDLYKFLAG